MSLGIDLVKSPQIESLGPAERWQMLTADNQAYQAQGWIIGRAESKDGGRTVKVEVSLLTNGRFFVERSHHGESAAERASAFFESSAQVLNWLTTREEGLDDLARAAWNDACNKVIGLGEPV